MPLPSHPNTAGRLSIGYKPCRNFVSMGLIPAACMRINRSDGDDISGFSISHSSSTSGAPTFVIKTDRIIQTFDLFPLNII